MSKMLFTQDFNKYGQKFKIRLMANAEVMAMNNIGADEKKSTELLLSIILDDSNKPVFKNVEEVENCMPPIVLKEIFSISAGVEKKSE